MVELVVEVVSGESVVPVENWLPGRAQWRGENGSVDPMACPGEMERDWERRDRPVDAGEIHSALVGFEAMVVLLVELTAAAAEVDTSPVHCQ